MAILNGRRYALTPAHEAEIFELHRLAVGTVPEIAEAYGVGASTVYVCLKHERARRFDAAVQARTTQSLRALGAENAALLP